MKRVSVIICLSLFLTASFAQSTMQGIYLSAGDFSNNKISFIPVQGKKYNLCLNEFFYKPTIIITIGDSTYTVNKDSVFGYRDNENNVYRFSEKNVYKLMNPKENILLYSRTFLGGYKNSQTVTKYYFSANANATVQPLTKWNLKNDFPNDSAFHELLDMKFNSDNDLSNYDLFYKMYKVNRVFQFSQQLIITNK
jgi:hypothetical protein